MLNKILLQIILTIYFLLLIFPFTPSVDARIVFNLTQPPVSSCANITGCASANEINNYCMPGCETCIDDPDGCQDSENVNYTQLYAGPSPFMDSTFLDYRHYNTCPNTYTNTSRNAYDETIGNKIVVGAVYSIPFGCTMNQVLDVTNDCIENLAINSLEPDDMKKINAGFLIGVNYTDYCHDANYYFRVYLRKSEGGAWVEVANYTVEQPQIGGSSYDSPGNATISIGFTTPCDPGSYDVRVVAAAGGQNKTDFSEINWSKPFLYGGFRGSAPSAMTATNYEVFDDHTPIYAVIDLIVNSIKPIQVLEGTSLVKDKATMTRVHVDLTDTNWPKNDWPTCAVDDEFDVSVKLNYTEGSQTSSFTAFRYMNNLATLKQSWKDQNFPADINKTRIEKIKKGENSVNFFDIPVLTTGTKYFTAKVDPSDTIKEWNENNNEQTPPSTVREQAKDITILPVIVVVGDPADFPSLGAAAFASALAKGNYEFLLRTYPLVKDRTELLDLMVRAVERKPQEDMGDLRERIFKKLKETKDSLNAAGIKVDYIMGLVDKEILVVNLGNNQFIRATGMAYADTSKGIVIDNIFLMSKDILDGTYEVATHEIGHLEGMYLIRGREQYELYPHNGRFTFDGWCLNQDTAQSCSDPGDYPPSPIAQRPIFNYGARMNIWSQSDQTSSPWSRIEDMIEGEWQSKIKVDGQDAPRFYDIMGKIIRGGIWVVNDISTDDAVYDYLISRFTNP